MLALVSGALCAMVLIVYPLTSALFIVAVIVGVTVLIARGGEPDA